MKLSHDIFVVQRCCCQSIYLFHSILFLLLILPAMSSSQVSSVAAVSIISPDRNALLIFKSKISDPSNALASWDDNTTVDFCRWRGVTCGHRHPDRVTSLNLDSLGLAATSLPPHIANFTFLRGLYLQSNNFSGRIPHELARLSRLTYLNLSFNHLDGEIPPNLTRCYNLRILDLLKNELSGEIPRDIGSLLQLQLLELGENNLTGTIPPSLANITSLLYLYLGANKLSGNIPSSLYNLSSIRQIQLSGNPLKGSLPSNMFNTLPNLRVFLMDYNHLYGPIPSSLSNATNLRHLEIADSNLTGTIPSNLGNLRSLYWLTLSGNLLEAEKAGDWDFLTSLTNCSKLEKLDIQLNNLGGILPPSVANLSSTLQLLSMSENQIAGTIPDGISNLVGLTTLALDNNLFSGRIPSSIGKLQQLHVWALSANSFTGQIPRTISNLSQLNYLYLDNNFFDGSIPAGIAMCQSMDELDLSKNMLTGAIPKELVMIPFISTFIDLSHNLLSGTLPSEIGQLTHLDELAFSHNKLSGKIPTTLGHCQSLELLYMHHNFFVGAIPQSLSNLKGLVRLDLSQNNLSGDFPKFMGTLTGLQYLNLSYNNLEGEVPEEGILEKNVTGVSLLGNKNLCGGNPELRLPVCYTQKKPRSRNLILKVIIPVVGACTCLVLFMIISFARYRLKNQRNRSVITSVMEGQFRQISYAELLKATDGFSPSNLIGVGSIGSVYSGILDLGGSTTVAVKVLNLERRGASKSFLSECDVLKKIRHRNLVKIITSCSSIDFSGNEFKALVLDFMPNGSLEKWLHPTASWQSETVNLSLDERLNIVIDVASALEYLHHHHSETPIVHCDLKPSNILLDADMCAHVGDFGLARFIWEKLPGPDEYQTTSTGIKGTIGYVAPEYGMGGQASTYGDVYSFGILLLELITGKRPTNEMFMDGLSLRNYVEKAFPERVMDIVDSRLCLFDKDPETKEYACLVSLIGIGLSCSKEDPRERMETNEITKKLQSCRDVLRAGLQHMNRE